MLENCTALAVLAQRLIDLEAATKIFKKNFLKFKYMHSVWFVGSRVGALTTLVSSYPAVVLNLNETGNAKRDEATSGKVLLKKCRHTYL